MEEALPDGRYPLQIGSIALVAQAESGTPAGSKSAQTRVAETADGSGSIFEDGDRIGVRIGDSEATGVYVIRVDDAGTVTVTPETPVYWQNTQPATVTAWYPLDEEIDFTQQDTNGLAYLLQATGPASYNTPASLTFTHQLAKVRVMLTGLRASAVQAVTVRSHPKSENRQGTLGAATGGDPVYVPMLQTSYNGQPCWEATLRDGTLQADASFRLTPAGGGNPMQAVLANNVSIAPAYVYNITITVNPYPDGAQDITGDINGGGPYKVEGSRTTPINITGGSPHIYLYNANVSVGSGPAISITNGATPTIHVVGDGNTVQCTGSYSEQEGAGIYVASGSSVTIQGSSRGDVLTAQTSRDGAGIGGYGHLNNQDNTVHPCGDITIRSVTVHAYAGGGLYMYPGIGSASTCGTIKIEDATVYARGCGQSLNHVPAIGSYSSTVPTIEISDSDIYAHRGGSFGTCTADYIGRGSNDNSYAGGQIQGTISHTTVYQYMYDSFSQQSTEEGSRVFE